MYFQNMEKIMLSRKIVFKICSIALTDALKQTGGLPTQILWAIKFSMIGAIKSNHLATLSLFYPLKGNDQTDLSPIFACKVRKFYRLFHGFVKAKFADDGSILGSS